MTSGSCPCVSQIERRGLSGLDLAIRLRDALRLEGRLERPWPRPGLGPQPGQAPPGPPPHARTVTSRLSIEGKGHAFVLEYEHSAYNRDKMAKMSPEPDP